MRNLFMAAVIAMAAPFAAPLAPVFAAPAEAATTKIIIKDGGRRPGRVVIRRDRRCVTKKVVRFVRGERIVRTERVCRR